MGWPVSPFGGYRSLSHFVSMLYQKRPAIAAAAYLVKTWEIKARTDARFATPRPPSFAPIVKKGCLQVKRKPSKLACGAAVLCALVTVLLTVFPLSDQQRAMISQRDKLIHVAVFSLLTTCVAWALTGFLPSRTRVLMLTAVLLVIFASIDELSQWLTPTRTVDLVDWLANCVGIAIGLFVYLLVAWRFSASFAKGD